MPRKKRLLVFVNPYSGTKKGIKTWVQAREVLEKANFEIEVIQTTHQNHAREVVMDMSKVGCGSYDVIATVSGDGLPHEVVNGLMERPDSHEFFKSTALAIIPGGTSNGMHKNIVHFSGERYGVPAAAYLLCKAWTRNLDLIEIEGEFFQKKVYSLMMVAWGIVADVDISSEVIRFMGNSRITIFSVLRIIQDPAYQCKLAFDG